MKEHPTHTSAHAFSPRVKHGKQQVIVETVGDELVVYDLANRQCHALNETAAEIWRQCDGSRSVSEIARQIHPDPSVPEAQAESATWLGLSQLKKCGLMEEPAGQPFRPPANLSRRQLLQLVGGLLVLPVVATIPAPAAHAANSLCPCFDEHQPCLNPGGGCSAAADDDKCLPGVQTDCRDPQFS